MYGSSSINATQGDDTKLFPYTLIKYTYFFFSRMTGAQWASQDQTEFLYTFIPDYYKINKEDKNYVPFWTRLQEKWFELYPELEVCFPDKEVDDLLPDEQAQVTGDIQTCIKVTKLLHFYSHFD